MFLSIVALQWVETVTLGKSGPKCVLLALANCHHEKKGECVTSLVRIMQLTELNKKTVIKWLEWLEYEGLITTQKRRGAVNNYLLHMDQTSPKFGTGIKSGSSSNFGPSEGEATGSKNGTGQDQTSPKFGTGSECTTSSKNSTNQFQKFQQPVPNLEHLQDNRSTGYTPPLNTPPQEIESASENFQLALVPSGPTDQTKTPEQIADVVIDALNHFAGKNFKHTETNRSHITARLRDGHSPQDCLSVITRQVMQWKGTDMDKFLRPETLFRPSKFEGYLNDNSTTQPAGGGGQASTQQTRHRSLQDDLNDTSWATGGSS